MTRRVSLFGAVFFLTVVLLGCQQDKAAQSTPATGSTSTTAISPSEAQKKIQEIDKVIAQIQKDPSMPAAVKQSTIAAMEKSKAGLQAKAN